MPEPENARDRVIVQRIRTGDTYEAIGNDCGITRQRVQQIAERYGVRPLRVDEKPLGESELLVARLLESEPRLSYREVAEHTGLSQGQVRRVAEKAGVSWMRWPVYRRGIQPWDYDGDADSGCWIWRHGKSAQGHGRLNVGKGRSEYAHRFAYEQRHGPIPPGAAIIHLCGNYSCVNPEHLSVDHALEGAMAERQQVDFALACGVADVAGEFEEHLELDVDDANTAAQVGQPTVRAGTSKSNGRTTMALVYDFDGTLAPGNMQERQFIPDIGMTPGEFWSEVDRLSRDNQADGVLMYMYYMLRKAAEEDVPVRLGDLQERGRWLEYFPGVLDWFGRINEYGESRGILVEHYIVSSGNAEIIEGTPVANLVDRIYASRFLFDRNGVAVWPALAVNYTTKTQFLFRINKGAHDLSDDRGINRFVKQEDRPVPFENMVYIGDGETDVPCFRLVKDLGGLSVAVFPPRTRNASQNAQRFVDEGRVHCVAPADYTENSRLDGLVKANIDLLVNREALGLAMVRS